MSAWASWFSGWCAAVSVWNGSLHHWGLCALLAFCAVVNLGVVLLTRFKVVSR